MVQDLRLRPAPLPEKLEDWQRKLKAERTLNDLTEDMHRLLCDDDSYIAYLQAVYDSDAVEGSLAADNIMAAQMIRERAKKAGSEMAKQSLATIGRCLGVVLRRYELSRKQRRDTVGGVRVKPENVNNDE
jgi:hypothetical protein